MMLNSRSLNRRAPNIYDGISLRMMLNRRDFNLVRLVRQVSHCGKRLRMMLNRRPLNPTFSNQMIHEWLENDVKS